MNFMQKMFHSFNIDNQSSKNEIQNKELLSSIPQPTVLPQKIYNIDLMGLDEYFVEAGYLIIEYNKASIEILQRHFKIGYNRAARIIDQLAEVGVVGEEAGTKPRKVLMSKDIFELLIANLQKDYNKARIERELQLEEEKLISEKERIKFCNTLKELKQHNIQISEHPISRSSESNILAKITYSNITKNSNYNQLANYVVIDVETTGLNEQDEIIELTAIKFESFTPIEIFSTLLKPRNPIPLEITKINNITDDMVKSKPSMYDIMDDLQCFINNYNLVGHNLPFDMEILSHYNFDIYDKKRRFYDTLALSKRQLKSPCKKWNREFECYDLDYDREYNVENYKLETLCDYYGIPLIGAHRSDADCLATGLLFQKIVEAKFQYTRYDLSKDN